MTPLFFHQLLGKTDALFLAANAGGGSYSARDLENILLCVSGNILFESKKKKAVQKYLRRQREPLTAATAATLPPVSDD